MDISPRQEPRHTHDSLSPTLFPSPSSHQHHPAASSNSHLATLLADAYREAESLRKDLSITRRALEKAERVYQVLEFAEAAGSSSATGTTGTTPATTTATTPPTTNGDQQQQQKYHHLLNNPTALKSVIDQYEKLLAQSQADRARAEEGQREALDAVRMLDDLLSALDNKGKAVTRPILEAASMLSPSLSTMRSMAPPPGLPTARSRAAGPPASAAGAGSSNAPGRLAPFSLPPHPTPIRTHSPSGSTSSRRPRTPSVDSMYGAAAPPNKKARPAGDDPSTSRGREPRVAYSESYITGEYNNRPILPLPQRSSAASESMAGPRSLDANNNNKNNINSSGGGAANNQRRAVASTHRPNHVRSESHSSASSMDVDEMIFKATVGDENMNNGVGVNGRHHAYIGSPHHGSQHLLNNAPTMTRAGTKRALMMGDEDALSAGTESPRGRALSLSNNNNHSSYPGGYPPSNASSSSMRGPIPPGNNANSNGGGAGQGNQGSAGGSGSSSHVYTTHVFAPPMTGAPTKKPKFPNSVMGGGASSSLVGSGGGGGSMGVGVGGGGVAGSMGAGMGGGGRGGSSPGVGSGSSIGGVDVAAAASAAGNNGKGVAASTSNASANASQVIPSAPFPATNERGQRICRQCGIVGRYKDGKCVEKWGPGPCGPGTVCDRCRKKMKRVERRGTLEQQQLQLQQQQQQQLAFQARAQAQQHQPTPASHAQLPLSQGSDRSVQRSDTLITADASLGPGAFAGASGSRKEEPSSFVAGSSTSSNATVRPGGSTSQARIIASAAQRYNNQPPPPSIASLRKKYGDDDDEEEEEGAVRSRAEAGGVGDDVEDEIDEFLLSADRDQPPLSNIGRGSAVAASVHSSSRSSSRNGVVRPSNGNGGSANNTKQRTSGLNNAKASPLGAAASSRAPSDADAEADADDGDEAEAEILGAIEAVEAAQAAASASASGAGSARGDDDDEDAEEEGGEEDEEDGSERGGGLLGDGDPDAELLEAVDAAEANSNASSGHGGGNGWMKSEN